MQWFKHLARARRDPFIWDLRQRFGGEGYFVYFATLEIYAESYRPEPGWFLNVSIDYLKNELGFYHTTKIRSIIDFIRCWPDMEGERFGEDPGDIGARLGKDRALSLPDLPGNPFDIYPKWVANLSNRRVLLLIPNFSKIMDEYTKRKAREKGDLTGHSPDSRRADKNQSREEKEKEPESAVTLLFRDIARDCETLSELPPVNGRRFPGSDFVGISIKAGYHPGAIRDATSFLVHKWQSKQWGTIDDPFALARGVAKSRNQYYDAFPVDQGMVRNVFGAFFNER